MHDVDTVSKGARTEDGREVRIRCSVCLQTSDIADRPTVQSRPGLTCGLCGGIIFLATSDVVPCQSCGRPILSAADGVKLCDGTTVHTVCETAPRTA